MLEDAGLPLPEASLLELEQAAGTFAYALLLPMHRHRSSLGAATLLACAKHSRMAR